MGIEVSFGWDNHEKALFPNQHRSINLDNDKPCIITGRNGSGKTLFIKILNKIFSVISSKKEDVYIDSKRFFEDIGLSWAKVGLSGLYIKGGGSHLSSGWHDFQKLSIPNDLGLYRTGGIESDMENENIEYKIHADVVIEKMAQVPEIRVEFYLSYEYNSSHCFVILNDEGEYEDEEYVFIESKFYSKKPFQTIHYDNLRVLSTEELFDDIDEDLLFTELQTGINFSYDNIEKKASNYDGFDFDEYEYESNHEEGGQPFFRVPKVKHLKEKRKAPKIDNEFGIFFSELVKIKSSLKPIIDEYDIILSSNSTWNYSIFYDMNEVDGEICSNTPPEEELVEDEISNHIRNLGCDDAMKLIPILWSTNYKSFKNLGFGTADEEFSYEKSRHIITVEERYQFFNDISDIFGNISSWPLRNRFNILKENLNKLIETDLLTKCLHKTSVSMPGDSNKNFQYLRGFIHYFSYRSYIGNYFQKYEPLVRLFEKFFQEDSENSTESYAKFLEDINNQEIIPSGYQNLLSMTMSVAEYSDVNDIVVFLDEPEISLHISWQIKLVPFLYGLLDTKDYPPPFSTFLLRNSNKFLIIATHSPEIVSGLLENTVDFSSNIDL